MRLEINMSEFIGLSKNHFDDSKIINIMEIGSLNGNDSLFFKSVYPEATVYCIEGLPDNFNTYLKPLTNIVPINIVICDYDGEITFHKKKINGLHGIFNRGNEYGVETLVLPCKTFKSLCLEHNIPNIDLLKIDVEGATYQVLVSMGEMIKGIKIMHIETESYPFFEGQTLHNDVTKYLMSNGFTLLDMTSVNINGGHQHDSVWINNLYLK